MNDDDFIALCGEEIGDARDRQRNSKAQIRDLEEFVFTILGLGIFSGFCLMILAQMVKLGL